MDSVDSDGQIRVKENYKDDKKLSEKKLQRRQSVLANGLSGIRMV